MNHLPFLQIYRYHTSTIDIFVFMVICWYFFKTHIEILIAWCLTPTLAVFQLYSGIRNIEKKTYRNVYYQVVLLCCFSTFVYSL